MKALTTLLSIIASVLLLVVSSIAQEQGSCGYWDGQEVGEGTDHYFNDGFHITGNHYMDAARTGTCTYTCPPGQCVPNTQCIATIHVVDTPSGKDTGLVSGLTHVGKFNGASSTASNNGQITSPAAAGVVVAQCPLGICNLTISVTDTGKINWSVSGGSEIWSWPDTYNGFCPSQHAFPQTPIIIDTENEGFQLTNPANGVITDMVWPGHPFRFAWTKAESHNAFLYLNGHLFGNNTPQPSCDGEENCYPNGFRALAVYDTNHDGVINALDPVFTELRLWIDANHDGTVQPEELFTLPSLKVYSISLQYTLDKHYDAQGNLYRFRGHLQKEGHGVDRTIYDVLLTR